MSLRGCCSQRLPCLAIRPHTVQGLNGNVGISLTPVPSGTHRGVGGAYRGRSGDGRWLASRAWSTTAAVPCALLVQLQPARAPVGTSRGLGCPDALRQSARVNADRALLLFRIRRVMLMCGEQSLRLGNHLRENVGRVDHLRTGNKKPAGIVLAGVAVPLGCLFAAQVCTTQVAPEVGSASMSLWRNG